MDNMNNPFQEYLGQNKELEELNQELDQLITDLLYAGLRALSADEKVIHLTEKLVENGCPPVAILKTMIDINMEEKKHE